jgi:glycosyltransferase involved in cell wall biosynthesis
MTSVFVLPPREDWICDRLVKEFKKYNADICVNNPADADTIWLLSDWCWRHLPLELLRSKKVLTTIHHIVPDKFGPAERAEFDARDQITTHYQVYNERVLAFVKQLTQKPVTMLRYWANQKIWKPTRAKHLIRADYDLPQRAFVVGSFQRDTEGSDLISPKLEKGPDIFCDFLEKHLNASVSPRHRGDLTVLLSGWRRQYVVNRLNAANIKFKYVERPGQRVVNELYQACDFYVVSSRCEGGPQALLECGLTQTTCISRPVGIAEQVLPASAINDDLSLCTPAIPVIPENQLLPHGTLPYRDLVLSL